MADIAGYQYRADTYCEGCILDVVKANNAERPRVEGSPNLEDLAEILGVDANDEYSFDSDNFPKVIFSWDEAGDCPDICGACHSTLDTSWHESTMNYAYDALEEAVVRWLNSEDVGDREVLDEWAQRLAMCIGESDRQKAILEMYNAIPAHVIKWSKED